MKLYFFAKPLIVIFISLFFLSCISSGDKNGPSYSDMVFIQAAGKSFIQGYKRLTPNAEAVRKVTLIRNFKMDATEITRGEYWKIMGMDSIQSGDSSLPISNITWFDAILYCNARSKAEGIDTFFTYDSVSSECSSLGGKCDSPPGATKLFNLNFKLNGNGYRLPTFSERAFAMNGADTAQFFWGSDPNGYKQFAWIKNNQDPSLNSSLKSVGQKKPNFRGLYDMLGNVSEWILDNGGTNLDTGDVVDPFKLDTAYKSSNFIGGSINTDLNRLGFDYYTVSYGASKYGFRDVGFRCVITAK